MVDAVRPLELADSQTHGRASCGDYLRDEAVDASQDVPGLLVQGVDLGRRGRSAGAAIYVFESAEAAEQQLPSRARELIGKDPDIVEVFDLEASVSVADAARASLGLAFEP